MCGLDAHGPNDRDKRVRDRLNPLAVFVRRLSRSTLGGARARLESRNLLVESGNLRFEGDDIAPWYLTA
jgi:hypothetical protein